MWHRVCRTKSIGMRRVACGCAVSKVHSALCLWTCSRPGLDCRSSHGKNRDIQASSPKASNVTGQPIRHTGVRRRPNPSPPPLGGLFEGLILTTKPDMPGSPLGPSHARRNSIRVAANCSWQGVLTGPRLPHAVGASRPRRPMSPRKKRPGSGCQSIARVQVPSAGQCRTSISCAHEAPGEQ